MTKFLVPVNDMPVRDSGFKFSIYDSLTHCPEVRKLEDVLIVQESAFKESPDLVRIHALVYLVDEAVGYIAKLYFHE